MSQSQSQAQQIQELQAQLRRATEENSHLWNHISRSATGQPYQVSQQPASCALDDPTPLTHNVPFQRDGMSRSNTVPRTPSLHGHNRSAMNSRLSADRHHNHVHSVKRPRVQSQQAPVSQRMDRSASNLSTRSDGPFTLSGPVSPLQTTRLQTKNTGMIDDYMNHHEPPVTASPAFASASAAACRSARLRNEMPTVDESGPQTGVVMDPADFLATLSYEDPSNDAFGSSVPSQGYDCVPQFNVTNPSTCGSMTSGQTYEPTDMSRQNSSFGNESVSGGVRMLQIDSQMSHSTDEMGYPDSFYHGSGSGENSPLGKRPYPDALLAVGCNLTPPFASDYPASAPTDGLLGPSDMERSASNTSMASTKSNSSLKARAKDTLKQQVQRGKNAPLQPKPAVDPQAAAAAAEAAKTKDGKAAIVKHKYVRPRQPKVFCDQCDEHKEGFRGEHELRRHKDAKHQDLVKKYICVDPVAQGLPVSVQAVNPLAKCKACKSQKKYGAYYNAAAHLRRTHFKEKPSRQKNKGGANKHGDEDKRGGKGGGDWPPMAELKNWMQEIHVSKYELGPAEDDDCEDDAVHAGHGGGSMSISLTGMGDFSGQEFNSPLGDRSDDVLAELNTNYPGSLSIGTDNSFLGGAMPLSSANFDFTMSPNTSQSFISDYSTFSPQEPMSQSCFSSGVSSSATVTPHTGFNETSQLEELDFNPIVCHQ
jgi:hypothetical protein